MSDAHNGEFLKRLAEVGDVKVTRQKSGDYFVALMPYGRAPLWWFATGSLAKCLGELCTKYTAPDSAGDTKGEGDAT